MSKLFWGLVLVCLDVKITVAEKLVIGLLPDFLGYILILQGCDALWEKSGYFRRGKVWTFGMVICSLIVYVMELFALAPAFSLGNILLRVLSMAAGLVVSWHLVRGAGELECANSRSRQEKLRSLWLVMAVMEVIACLFSWVPVVNTVAALALAVVALCFLAAFYQIKKDCEGI